MKFYVFNTSSDKVGVNYSLSLGLLNTERKPSIKKRSTGPESDRSTGRSICRLTSVHFEFYWSGRVKKILTGSICESQSASHCKAVFSVIMMIALNFTIFHGCLKHFPLFSLICFLVWLACQVSD